MWWVLWARDSDIKVMSVLRMLRMQELVVGWEKEEQEEERDEITEILTNAKLSQEQLETPQGRGLWSGWAEMSWRRCDLP